MKRYTKLLLGLKSISQRIYRKLLFQAPYIIYYYLETKMVLEQISDRPARSGREKPRPLSSLVEGIKR
jgi:hypothetical protein